MCTWWSKIHKRFFLLLFFVQVVDGDIVKHGISFAKSVANQPVGPRRISDWKVNAPQDVHKIFDGNFVWMLWLIAAILLMGKLVHISMV